MSQRNEKQVIVLLSIVERGKGTKLIKTLEKLNMGMHFQCIGFGTAPTEMMDIFGLGSNDKDIIISFAAERRVIEMMGEFGNSFGSYSAYGGLMMVLGVNAINRLVSEILHLNMTDDIGKGAEVMKNEHKHNLIMINVGQGYTDEVMETARKAGATGGTVIRGRWVDVEKIQEFVQKEFDEEREIILIMAPAKNTGQIMDEVNQKFGMRTDANGILSALPIEKAYKI